MTIARLLARVGACEESLLWVRSQRTHSARKLWARCDHPDWLLWLLNRCGMAPDDSLISKARAEYSLEIRAATANLRTAISTWAWCDPSYAPSNVGYDVELGKAYTAYYAVLDQARATYARNIRAVCPMPSMEVLKALPEGDGLPF